MIFLQLPCRSLFHGCEAKREDFEASKTIQTLKIDLEIMLDLQAHALIGQDVLKTLGLPSTVGSTQDMTNGVIYRILDWLPRVRGQ